MSRYCDEEYFENFARTETMCFAWFIKFLLRRGSVEDDEFITFLKWNLGIVSVCHASKIDKSIKWTDRESATLDVLGASLFSYCSIGAMYHVTKNS